MSETRPVNPGYYVPDNSGVIGEISPELEALLREVSELGDIATKSHVASAINYAMDGVSVAALVAANGGATKAYVDGAVAAISIPELPEGLATETFVTAAVADKATKAYVRDAIEALDIPDDIASRSYVDAAVAAIDIPELPTGTATEAYVDAKVADKATKAYVDGAVAAISIPELPEGLATETFVTAAVADKATKAYVDNAVADLVAGQIPDGVATEGYVDNAVSLLSTTLGSAATHDETDFATPTQVAGAVDAAMGSLGTAARMDAATLATKAEVAALGAAVPGQIASGVASAVADINFPEVFDDNGVATQTFVTATIAGALGDLGTAAWADAATLATKAEVTAAIAAIPDYVLPSNIATNETVQDALSGYGTAARLDEEDVVKTTDFPSSFTAELVKSDLTTALGTPEKISALATVLGVGGAGEGSGMASLDMGEVFGDVELPKNVGIIGLTATGNLSLTILPHTDVPTTRAVSLHMLLRHGTAAVVGWPENVTWAGSVPSTLSADGTATTCVVLLSVDGGHTWVGNDMTAAQGVKSAAFFEVSYFATRASVENLQTTLSNGYVTKSQYEGQALGDIGALRTDLTNLYATVANNQSSIAGTYVTKSQYEGQALGQIAALQAKLNFAPVALIPGASVVVDMSSGINFTLTASGTFTIANPTNAQPGQGGIIDVTLGGEAVVTFDANWIGRGFFQPPKSGGFTIAYFVVSPSRILFTIAAGS